MKRKSKHLMKNLLWICSALLLLTSCKKDIDELPEATQTGANTFGARVNGELWAPQKFGIAPTKALVEARYAGDNSVFINARNFASSPTETEFEIYIRNITGPGTYVLNQNTDIYPSQSASYAYFVKRRFSPQHEWITSSSQTGTVTVTRFDTVNHVISGSFEFNGTSIGDTDAPLTVTEGRFDARIQ